MSQQPATVLYVQPDKILTITNFDFRNLF